CRSRAAADDNLPRGMALELAEHAAERVGLRHGGDVVLRGAGFVRIDRDALAFDQLCERQMSETLVNRVLDRIVARDGDGGHGRLRLMRPARSKARACGLRLL